MIYAYETDGYGMYNLMDDANVPSLLSIDYLGYPSDPDIGENTRRFLLSNGNPIIMKEKKRRGSAAPIRLPATSGIFLWRSRA